MQYTVATIQWIDSQTVYGWSEYDPNEDHPEQITTVGIIVAEDSKSITVSIGASANKKYTGKMSIPKCAIKKLIRERKRI